jgi:hypothetical protein
VVRVTGDAVRAEGQHDVRADLFDHGAQPPDRVGSAHLGALAVAVSEPVMLSDPEDLQAARQLAGALRGQPVRRPRRRVGRAELAAGRGHAYHARSAVAGQRHQPTGQVRLVVRVSPDPKDGAQLGDAGCGPIMTAPPG